MTEEEAEVRIRALEEKIEYLLRLIRQAEDRQRVNEMKIRTVTQKP